MRVLMLNNEFPPLGGGTGSVNQALLTRLAERDDLEIDLVTSARGRTEEEERFAGNIKLYKVPVHNVNIHHSTAPELIRYAIRGLRKARGLHDSKPYDLAMGWSTVPAGWITLRLRRRAGVPYIVRVGGPDIPGYEKRYRPLYPFLKPTINATWRQAHTVVAKCPEEANLIRTCRPSQEVTIIPNGVDPERFVPAQAVPSPPPLRLVCVARLIRHKRQADILQAMAALVKAGFELTLDLVGTGDDEARLRKIVGELRLHAKVAFSGYVPRSQVSSHYHAANVFVLASEREGMSISTMEAMACGLPIIVTRTGGTEDLVKNGVNGFTFPPGNTARLEHLLRELVEGKHDLATMGNASRARAEQFTWDRVSNRFLSVFLAASRISDKASAAFSAEKE